MGRLLGQAGQNRERSLAPEGICWAGEGHGVQGTGQMVKLSARSGWMRGPCWRPNTCNRCFSELSLWTLDWNILEVL